MEGMNPLTADINNFLSSLKRNLSFEQKPREEIDPSYNTNHRKQLICIDIAWLKSSRMTLA